MRENGVKLKPKNEKRADLFFQDGNTPVIEMPIFKKEETEIDLRQFLPTTATNALVDAPAAVCNSNLPFVNSPDYKGFITATHQE